MTEIDTESLVETSSTTRVHLASIFHITDLHLCLARDGGVDFLPERQARISFGRWRTHQLERIPQIRWLPLVRRVPKLATKVSCQGVGEWTALKAELKNIIEDELQRVAEAASPGEETVPVIVAQTGDIAAYGGTPRDEQRVIFPEIDFVENKFWRPLRENGVIVVNMFGNHDVMSGRIPSLKSPRRVFESLRTYSLTRPFPIRLLLDPLPVVAEPSVSCPNGTELELVAINTVAMSRRRALLAQGVFSSTPHHRTRRAVQAELRALLDAAVPARKRIRIGFSHHPACVLERGVFKRFTTGWLKGRRYLESPNIRNKFDFFISGHLHEVHPEQAGTTYAGRWRQLVAESPTQNPSSVLKGISGGPNSFSLYRLYEIGGGSLEMTRQQYKYQDLRTPQDSNWRAVRKPEPVYTDVPIRRGDQ